MEGRWSFEANNASYLGPERSDSPSPYGVAISDRRARSGTARVRITLDEGGLSASGRIILGRDAATGRHFAVGIGGQAGAFGLSEFLPSVGWRSLTEQGDHSNLQPGRSYNVIVTLLGSAVSLTVNDVVVLQRELPYPLPGDQVGLFASGAQSVHFAGFEVQAEKPRAFVVMQFTPSFDTLYRDVIKPVSEGRGLDAQRADDVFGPGIILQDIVRGLVEADVVIAEITPENANVFYELGYAHALGKPTILLAERGAKLPFDISGYRVIFYDNTIGGKNDVERNLTKHLDSILAGRAA
jgi:hypothetical protein